MSKGGILSLMEYCQRDLGYSQRFLDEGEYPKSIDESYYSAFYAAKARLLHLGIRTKSHQSVQAGIDTVVEDGSLPHNMKGVLQALYSRRNEAVYRYAKNDWTAKDASDTLWLAQHFIQEIRSLLSRPGAFGG